MTALLLVVPDLRADIAGFALLAGLLAMQRQGLRAPPVPRTATDRAPAAPPS
jgi:hypothetical protein